jgi:hypothetical protein
MTRAADAARLKRAPVLTPTNPSWSGGGLPEGWSMPVCEIDLRVGGRYRYVAARQRKKWDGGHRET